MFVVKDVCQGTSNGFTTVAGSADERIAALRDRYGGCKYVDGNLEITGLDEDEFYSRDLSFLNSIREVCWRFNYYLITSIWYVCEKI